MNSGRKIVLPAFIATVILISGWLQPGVCMAEGSAYTRVDGYRVHYVKTGMGTPAMVFIPGWRCDQTIWRKQAEAFRDRHKVIMIDLPGFGKSSKPDVEYTHDLFVRGVEAVMQHAGLERAVIVGHSMGASVARQFALKHPDMVTGLVIVDGALFEMPKDPENQAKWKDGFEAFTSQFMGTNGEANTENFFRSLFLPSTPSEIKEEIIENVMATPAYVGQSAMKNFMDPGLWSEEPVNAPTLAVYAESSEQRPEFRAYLNRVFPNLTFVEVKNADHFFMLAKPDELNRPLAEFLTTLNGK